MTYDLKRALLQFKSTIFNDAFLSFLLPQYHLLGLATINPMPSKLP